MKIKTYRTIILLFLCLAVTYALAACKNNNANSPISPSDVVNHTNPAEGSVAETLPSDISEIYGIPPTMFNNTCGHSFQMALKNTNTGNVFEITPSATYRQMKVAFNDSDETQNDTVSIKPKKTKLRAEVDSTSAFNMFVYGVVNTSEQEICFEDARLVYIEYGGDSRWELCGINTDMTQEQVVAKLGEPTQVNNIDIGCSMEWYVLIDGHVYWINVRFDSDNGRIRKIVLSVDNYPVHAND